MIENNQFDRYEGHYDNYYRLFRGTKNIEKNEYQGILKCKLLHTSGSSIIVPEFIFLKKGKTIKWFQVFSFLPNMLTKFSNREINGQIFVDISGGHTLEVKFNANSHIKNLVDNSNLFECKIWGPEKLEYFATGEGLWLENKPHLYLYHHTLPKFRDLIEQSQYLIPSQWNYQGTKKLNNIGYIYFSCLNEIKTNNDLKMIAMSHDEEITLIQDITNEVIKIKVYRESTENRNATLKFLVNAELLSTNHIWKHTHDTLNYVYYEFANPFIYRIGIEPENNLKFTKGKKIENSEKIKEIKYVVIGDATSKEGIRAPFDEENTSQIFKVESFRNDKNNILKFWFNNGNKDLFSKKKVELQSFV